MQTGECLYTMRQLSCNSEPNGQILSCDSVCGIMEKWLVAIGTYDGGLFILQ